MVFIPVQALTVGFKYSCQINALITAEKKSQSRSGKHCLYVHEAG